ncbi:MAG: cysteine desulfurase family protein [Planctomycetota bacterium]|jgi:cysteine desulfurase
MSEQIYFDHAATTPVAPDVREVMLPWLGEKFGNAATLYGLGAEASEAVGAARAAVARLLGSRPEEVYFTSCGTESDNWALKGVGCVTCSCRGGAERPHIITDKAEHHAVLDTCEFLEGIGADVTYLEVDGHGRVNHDDVKKAIRPSTKLISVMHANNEVGSVNPVTEIAKIAREHEVLMHTDAVQTVGKLDFTVESLGVDLLSLSAHKFHGPKGVGALYVRKGVRIASHMHGGGQEYGKRAGTSNVPGIVGLGAAACLACRGRDAEARREQELSERLIAGVTEHIEEVKILGHPSERLPGTVCMVIAGIEGEAMVLSLDAAGFAVASGSACTTGSLDPSHVLLAMGLPAEVAHGSLRLSFGHATTQGQVNRFLEAFPPIVEKLRRMSPTWRK